MEDFDRDDLTPKLVFTTNREGDKLGFTVSFDRAKSIFGWASRDNAGLEMPGTFWARVIPALVARMDEAEREELFRGIAERVGVEFPSLAGATVHTHEVRS